MSAMQLELVGSNTFLKVILDLFVYFILNAREKTNVFLKSESLQNSILKSLSYSF